MASHHKKKHRVKQQYTYSTAKAVTMLVLSVFFSFLLAPLFERVMINLGFAERYLKETTDCDAGSNLRVDKYRHKIEHEEVEVVTDKQSLVVERKFEERKKDLSGDPSNIEQRYQAIREKLSNSVSNHD